jgi:hypothetical protein
MDTEQVATVRIVCLHKNLFVGPIRRTLTKGEEAEIPEEIAVKYIHHGLVKLARDSSLTERGRNYARSLTMPEPRPY